MTSMGLRHQENSQYRRSRRHYYENLDHLRIQKKGVHNNLNCIIDQHFQHKIAATAYYKPSEQFQSQADDYFVNNRRFDYGCTDMDNNYDHSYNSCKYDKKNHSKMSSSQEKSAWNSFTSTAASESDSSSSNASSSSSELSGFKIVHEGKVVHNETEEELDSPSNTCLSFQDKYEKFAASVLVTGPNVREISIPSFL